MLSGLERRSLDTLARGELRLFDELGTQGSLSTDDRRRLLALTEPEWAAWRGFQQEGRMPSWPHLPDMLIRVATAAYGIAETLEPEPYEASGW